jgi:hypothetical protein
MAAHAKLSASGSKRWLACPPSARLEENFADEKSGYAAEGSFAHSLGELELKKYLALLSDKQYQAQLKTLQANTFYTQNLADNTQTYVDLAIEKINVARALSKDPVVLLEQRLDFSTWVPEGFGTGDLVLIADGVCEVVDLKFGKGIAVSAEENTQMRLYGLGALHQFDCLYDISHVVMTIVQPRLDSVSSEELTANELLGWANDIVKPKAKLAWAGEGEFVAGDHCKFCRARYTCRARAEENLKLAAYDFQDPLLLSPMEIGEILAKVESLVSWATDVQKYALDQAENHGVTWPGWKLVAGRSNRKYTDEVAVATALTGAGYEDKLIFEKSLYGITKMTENIGKKPFNTLLTSYIVKPPGKPALVPESDKRPAINSVASAQADFS